MLRNIMAIRKANFSDLSALLAIASAMAARHEAGYFDRCLDEQEKGNRDLLIAFAHDRPAGYVQLVWQSLYLPFRRFDIPEIQDLNVVPDCRCQGLGASLIDACEALARNAGKREIGISVGLYPRYGAAQRLYVKKGYVPDGAGVAYDETTVGMGEMRPVDDLLALKLVKTL